MNLRAATAPYQTDVLIYGAAFQRAARERAVADTRAQYASEPLLAGTTQLDVDLLKDWLTETHANTYSYLLWDTTGDDYLNLVRFLEATRDFCVDGRALRVWVTLIPPSEVSGARCSVAADSPSTPFAEATFFARGLAAPESCTDYGAWGNLLGALAARYPQLVAVNIDDFTANYPADIRPETVAALTSNLRAAAPWVAFVPTFYYHAAGGGFVGDSLPDLGAATDGGLFYFRNEAQGQGPCAACDTPRPCANACLADTCAEATVPNLAVEATRVAAGLFGHPLLIGLYVTGHSACGTPSVEYERAALEAALTLPIARGVTVYTTQHPAVDCAANGRADRGCVVQSAFARHP